MGLMNKLTTGNFIVDILICFMIPMIMDSDILATLKCRFKDGIQMMLSMVYPVQKKVQRTISYSYSFGAHGVLGGQDIMTERLQRAIDYYMSKQSKLWVSNSDTVNVTVDSCSDNLIMKTPSDTWTPMDEYTRLKVNKVDSGSVATSKYIDITYTIESTARSEHIVAQHLQRLRDIYGHTYG